MACSYVRSIETEDAILTVLTGVSTRTKPDNVVVMDTTRSRVFLVDINIPQVVAEV